MKSLREIILPVIDEIRAGRKTVDVTELWGASKALFLFGLAREARRPLIVLAASEQTAESIAEDIRFFSRRLARTEAGDEPVAVRTFPAWGVLPFEADSPDSRTVGERMGFLYALLSGGPGIFIVPSPSLAQKLLPWELFADSVRTITKDTPVDPDQLATALADAGYESASLVTRVGEFSRRGGILDFFSPVYEQPVRLELFGEAVESLRTFDPETQRSTGEIPEAVILPVREILLQSKAAAEFGDRYQRARDEYAAAGSGVPEQTRLPDEIRQGILSPGAEFLAPFFYGLDPLFRYIPAEAVYSLIEPEDIRKETAAFFGKAEAGRREESAEGRVLPAVAEFYLSPDEIAQALENLPKVSLGLLQTGRGTPMDTRSAAWLGVRLTKPVTAETPQTETADGTMQALVEKLRRQRDFNRVAIVCGTDESAERLKKLFMEYGLGVAVTSRLAAQEAKPFSVTIVAGRLSEGFAWPELALTVITEEEIFGRKVHRASTVRARTTPFLSNFKELKPGDFVVHTDYGVGEYQGLSHISLDGFETDFLVLRYEPDAKLYVPLYSLDKVQKYIGADGGTPKLDRLGAPAWARTKEKVRKDILAMARDLVALYATREALQRTAFTPPDNLYREFEAEFPYEETADQQRAIQDVLGDMQRPRPMDRVVCGDVGFGKTEVALRAAFKAVEDGAQVAVLVPTTLLADQHYRTFRERVAPFSIRVEMLSRFRSRAEQQDTVRGMKSGVVDIVIGTHRLLQKDVAFKNLGLLVVDEEHKFGVKHKERIKEFRKLVDVLTLTATPIPRTLHMSLSGIRDLSIIQTPPLDRQSIQVVLARFGKRIIREAVMRELDRGGQVFFVHNRVQGIERMAAFIAGLVPEAKVGIAHGQLNEQEIEDVMEKFLSGGLNVLVTTTIIESGIDIPTANTIIINRADRFGLADLYQIKGRVGRSREKAYAYLLAPEEEALSDIARKRLRAIQELSELGAGFRIAAQDLETRGAGNLLGKEQSGHIAAVGMDLYTQMMEEAIAELRGEEIEHEPDTQINMKASAFIPEDYIGDVGLRLAAYKEISGAADEAQLRDIRDELRDRYGEPPESVKNLLEIMGLKLLARKSGVLRIDAGTALVNVTFAETASISPDRLMVLLKKSKGAVRMVAEFTIRITLTEDSFPAAVQAVKKCLQELL